MTTEKQVLIEFIIAAKEKVSNDRGVSSNNPDILLIELDECHKRINNTTTPSLITEYSCDIDDLMEEYFMTGVKFNVCHNPLIEKKV